MGLTSGTKLGPYEIIAPLGAGGMGEVYRARDTRLDRIVAIKVLPEHLADRVDLRERFEREAHTIASLNHSHICSIYDVGHQNGTDYLVMEYLEGETLAQRLQKGPLTPEHLLQCAIQIADALDKAPQGHHASRFETRQHHADQERGKAAGLWPGEAEAADNPFGCHPFGAARITGLDYGRKKHPWNIAIHGPGATGSQGSGRTDGHLCVWRSAVRNGDGEKGLRRQEPGERNREDT